MFTSDPKQLKAVSAELVKAFAGGDVQAVTQFNLAHLTPVKSALAIVDSSAYSDPDAFTNKAELWAEQFKQLFGFKEHFWHYRQGRVDTFDYELWQDNNSGQWVIVFYDDKLFKQKGGLGAFVLITDDQSGSMAYFADKFTHGSNYYSAVTPIPSSVKRSKDLVKLVAEELGKWIASDLEKQHNLLYDAKLTSRKGTSLSFSIGIDTSDSKQMDRCKELITARMKQLGFSGITFYEGPEQYVLAFSGKLGHKILQAG